MPTYHLITGANAGLGLATIRHMVRDPQVHILAAIRNFDRAAGLRRVVPADRLTLFKVDVADLSSVRNCCNDIITWLGDRQLSSLCLNAGLQFSRRDQVSPEGFELTFATNLIGHHLMYGLLQPHLTATTRVVTIGSGTQNPNETTAKRFGFRDDVYRCAADLAYPEPSSEEPAQLGRDAYAASKRACIMWTKAMATRSSATHLSLNPGAMPGTGLARDNTFFARLFWHTVLRLFPAFVDGISTPKRSGKILADMLTDPDFPFASGDYVDFTMTLGPAHPQTFDPDLQTELLSTLDDLTGLAV